MKLSILSVFLINLFVGFIDVECPQNDENFYVKIERHLLRSSKDKGD